MNDTVIRPARGDEREAIVACVHRAYAGYVPRIEREPAPMHADYARLIAERKVYVIRGDAGIRGVIVCFSQRDGYFIENIAVDPAYQGQGLGRALMTFAERRACESGLPEIRLYTNERMVENLGYYRSLGYEEVGRRVEDGFHRVFFRKALRDA